MASNAALSYSAFGIGILFNHKFAVHSNLWFFLSLILGIDQPGKLSMEIFRRISMGYTEVSSVGYTNGQGN
jgi:hypothetical protein